MNRRLLAASLVAPFAGALALFACVGDTPVTPTPDAGADVNQPDVTTDAAPPLLTCQAGETLETIEGPMDLPSNSDLCTKNLASVSCNFATGTGVQYSNGALSAVATTGAEVYALAARAHEGTFGPAQVRTTEAIVTYEVSINDFLGDSGWHGFGCLIDQDTLDDAGTLKAISRLDIATSGSAAAAFTYVNGTHVGQTPVPLTGYSTTGPMTVTMRVDRRTTPKATVTLSSTTGNSTVNLSPTFGQNLALWCGVSHEAPNGVTKATISKIRYARCLKP